MHDLVTLGVDTHAIAPTSARLSIERSSTSRPTGVIIAPPMPCRMRARTKSVSPYSTPKLKTLARLRWSFVTSETPSAATPLAPAAHH